MYIPRPGFSAGIKTDNWLGVQEKLSACGASALREGSGRVAAASSAQGGTGGTSLTRGPALPVGQGRSRVP